MSFWADFRFESLYGYQLLSLQMGHIFGKCDCGNDENKNLEWFRDFLEPEFNLFFETSIHYNL